MLAAAAADCCCPPSVHTNLGLRTPSQKFGVCLFRRFRFFFISRGFRRICTSLPPQVRRSTVGEIETIRNEDGTGSRFAQEDRRVGSPCGGRLGSKTLILNWGCSILGLIFVSARCVRQRRSDRIVVRKLIMTYNSLEGEKLKLSLKTTRHGVMVHQRSDAHAKNGSIEVCVAAHRTDSFGRP